MFKRYLIPHHGNNHHPHFFRNTTLGFIATLSILLLSTSLLGSSFLKNNNLLGAIYASELVSLTNQDRLVASLGTLSVDETLVRAAELKAEDMVTKGYFAHTSPEGLSPWHWILKSGYKFVYAGENLAVNFNESEEVESAWMNSPGHRANILSNRFSEVGIAVKEAEFQGKKAIFVVQMFATPVKSKAAVAAVSQVPSQTPAIVVNKPEPTKTEPVELASAEVKGAALEITSEKTDEGGKNLFIAAKDPVAEKENSEAVELVEGPGTTKRAPSASNFWNRAILKFPLALNSLYAVIGIIAIFGIAMLIAVEVKHRKPRLIVAGFALLLILVGAMYANSTTTLFALATSLY